MAQRVFRQRFVCIQHDAPIAAVKDDSGFASRGLIWPSLSSFA
jgi:hypothetical protein